MATKKGQTLEELRRDKEKARKTMKQLNQSKVGEGKQGLGGGATTVLSGAGKSIMSNSTMAFAEGSPVDVILFGFRNKNSNMINSSFNASISTDSSNTNAHVVSALKHVIHNSPLVGFSIATVGPDGRRIYTNENLKTMGGFSKAPRDVALQTKIQTLLDQRKPPTEELPSLCELYDEDLLPLEATASII